MNVTRFRELMTEARMNKTTQDYLLGALPKDDEEMIERLSTATRTFRPGNMYEKLVALIIRERLK